MAKQKKAKKKIARRARRGTKKAGSKSPRPRRSAQARGKAAGKKKAARKPAPPKKAAARKTAPAATATAGRKATKTRIVAPSRISSGHESPAAGEVYGEGSWREEELSAAELETAVPELDELDADAEEGPEVAEESDDSEW